MGRILAIVLLVAGVGVLLVNGVSLESLDPRGVGTRIEGRKVLLDVDQIEASFTALASLDEAYMLFGGDAVQRRNGLMHGVIAGLPIRHARSIAASHPDFHRYGSAGAPQAQRLTENISVVAADRAARGNLVRAVDLYDERLHGSGERTCIRVRGNGLVLDSVRVKQSGEDLTRQVAPALGQMQLVLARELRIEDCDELLR